VGIRRPLLLAAFVAAASLPAAAVGAPPAGSGTQAGPPPHAKAYGRYCKGESTKHVAGEKGTPFSRCVKAMAKLDSGRAATPRDACQGLSRKHVQGEKGTAFGRCVKAGRKLLEDTAADSST
jgi:hypothetical protein